MIVTKKHLTALLVGILSSLLLKAQETSPTTTVEIDYQSAVYDFSGEQKKVTLSGPITIRTNTLVVNCDTAEILSSRKGEQAQASDAKLGSIDYIFAKGNVEIKQANSTAYAGEAQIYPAEKKLVLEKEPRIVDEYGTVSGHRIVFLQGERKIRIESGDEQQRSKIKINNVQEVGFLMGEDESSPEE